MIMIPKNTSSFLPDPSKSETGGFLQVRNNVYASNVKADEISIPALTNKPKQKISFYKQAQRLADSTKVLISSGNLKQAKYLMQVVEYIFINGNKETQNAISNVYVYSLSVFMEQKNCIINELLPKNLKSEYYKQINTLGL
jgi:hypothetical protein